MSKLVKIANPSPYHILEMACYMQEIDKESIELLSGMTPYEGLEQSVNNSNESYVWYVDNTLCGMGGISQVSFLSDYACPWLLCTDSIQKYKKTFMTETRSQVDEWVKTYGTLRNVVYSKHERSKRWLQWLGFKLGPAVPLGPEGALFHFHERVR